MGVMACLDNDVMACSDEGVVACLDNNNKDDFDMYSSLAHPLEYLLE